MSAVTWQMGGRDMNSVKHYLVKLTREVFHRGENFAVEGGISFGPGRDPKGSFYTDPKVAFYWNQPESVVVLDEPSKPREMFKGLLVKLSSLRLSA